MCYFEDCEDRYWPREDNTPDCPYEDCDNSTDTGNTNPGGTGTTNPGGGHICICNCDDCADGTIQVIQGSESISIISNDSNSKQLGNLYNQVKLLQAGKA